VNPTKVFTKLIALNAVSSEPAISTSVTKYYAKVRDSLTEGTRTLGTYRTLYSILCEVGYVLCFVKETD